MSWVLQKPKHLLITPPPVDWVGPFQNISGLGGYPCQKKIEQAGRWYEELCRIRSGFQEEKAVDDTKDEDEEETEETTSEQRARFEQKRHRKLVSGKMEDPYEILGLENKRWLATDDEIKYAYKKLALKYHPDKNTEINDEIFKKIQEAFFLLSDPRKRRAHDSNDEEGDYTIPSFTDGVDDFFSVFPPTFLRFSKFSVNKNIPPIGDDKTPYEKVKKFYDFWYDFKSWRDFSYLDEFDLNEAESRDERRWMERQNERARKKHKREEAAKVRRLTELAEKFDPRVKKYKEDERMKKEKIREEKARIAREKQEEIDRQAALEREQKEQEEKRRAEEQAENKKKRVAENKKLKKLRNKLRELCVPFSPTIEDTELVCARLNVDQLTAIISNMEQAAAAANGVEQAKKIFYDELNAIKKIDYDKQRADEKESNASNTPWTDEELSLLAKAMAKFPGGIQDRWEHIAQFVGTRSVKEIVAKTKETKFVPNRPNVKMADPFEKFAKTKKKPAQEIQSDLTHRDEVIAPTSPQQQQSGTAAATKSTTATSNGKAESTATAAATTTTTAAAADWSAEEQKALEKALSSVPATATDRWDKIAELVPGKSKKDCILRYKFLVAQIKEKKAAAQK